MHLLDGNLIVHKLKDPFNEENAVKKLKKRKFYEYLDYTIKTNVKIWHQEKLN